MPSLLLVTAVCQGDLTLAYKRLDWMKQLGKPQLPKDILLINDGSIQDFDFKKLGNAHVDSGLFPKVELRTILDPPASGAWPWTVNHVWRRTTLIVAGQYGLKFDGSEYYCWFYFEPDVTPINRDFAHILEAQYLFHKRQFMGRIHATRTQNGQMIMHMNGAACYPISNEYYNDRMMLLDGAPWDVGGMQTTIQPERLAEVPESAYIVQVGSHGFIRDGETIKGGQTTYDQQEHAVTFVLAQQILHHGCKDGSLIDVLSSRNGTQGDPVAGTSPIVPSETPGAQALPEKRKPGRPKKEVPSKPEIPTLKSDLNLSERVKADKLAGVPFRMMLSRYKVNPKKLAQLLK